VSVTERKLAEMNDRLAEVRDALAAIQKEVEALSKLRNEMAIRHTLSEDKSRCPDCCQPEHIQE